MTLIYRYKLNKRLYLVSFIYYMFGFALWNVDNKFCPWLRQYRTQIEYAVGVDGEGAGNVSDEWKRMFLNAVAISLKALSEFHSWWHVFTGYAAFMTILFLTDVHYKHYLLVNNKAESTVKYKPVESKVCNMYYHLSDNLLLSHHHNENEKSNGRPKRTLTKSTKKS